MAVTRSALRRARASRVREQGRGAALLDVDIEFGSEIGVDFEMIRRETDEYVTHRVREQAKAGLKPSGAKFRRYDAKYARWLVRHGDTANVDLTRTGNLLAAFQMLKSRVRRVSQTAYSGAELGVARRERKQEAQLIMEFGVPNDYIRQAIGLAALGFKFIALGKQDLKILAGVWKRAGLVIKKRGARRRKAKIGPVRPNGRF